MSFTEAWVETEPDGNIIFVSQLDDYIRTTRRNLRERLEGDPSVPDLTGLIEVGSWNAAPKPRKGTARVYVDPEATIVLYGVSKREDGRMAFANDSKKLFHVASGGAEEIGYISTSGGTITSGSFAANTGGFRCTSDGRASLGAGSISTVYALILDNAVTAGATQGGIRVESVASSAALTAFMGVDVKPELQAAAFTCADVFGVRIRDTVKGAGSALTTQRGIYIDDLAAAVTNYAIYTNGGLVRFGDAIVGFADSTPPLTMHRATNSGPVCLVDCQNAGAVSMKFLSFQRASVDQWHLGVGTGGEATIFCDAANTVFVRDSGASLFFQVDKGSGAGTTGLAIWDVNGGTFRRVTVGANDSGGAGFKLLRIPN
jgi:hypothetical protein